VMRQCFFEIVRRPYERYSWVFVMVKDGKRRVLARSARDYRSPKRVREAITAMKGAEIVDACGSSEREPFPVPATSFRLVSGVLPLMVDESAVEHDPAKARRRKAKLRDARAKPDKRTAERIEAEVSPQAAVQQGAVEAEAVEAPAEPKRAARGGGRRQAARPSGRRPKVT
jgi:hypothetical protein